MNQKDLEAAVKIMIMVENMAPFIAPETADRIVREEAEAIVAGFATLERAAYLKQEISSLERILEVARSQGRVLHTTQKMIDVLREKQYELSQQM
jgi:hypothetical protein